MTAALTPRDRDAIVNRSKRDIPRYRNLHANWIGRLVYLYLACGESIYWILSLWYICLNLCTIFIRAC